ncbi:SDR family NAD(P)-dependent oxidoreductase [Longitalea arenae]|uniref:SDR family NAD(P)-dependent oxidoreductase n=1 Tax=Longitalea arenae TaxID=2812558 RepID=UPI0019677C8F|nr:SDR family oxidoreductase [Longitalea arenae]
MSDKIYMGNDAGKVAVVIGASSGIGQSAAIEIARRGVGIILTYNSNKEGAEQTVQAIENAGGKAVALPLEAGESETFVAFKDAVARQLSDKWQRSTFTYLVNNAGFGQMALIEDTTIELFDKFVNVLFKAPFFITQKLLPMLENGGAIVNVTSNSALPTVVAEGYSVYASAKGALMVLTRYMAKEFSKRGIRVNSIAPGPTKTRFANDAFDKYPEVIAPLAAQTALARLGQPDDIGKVIASVLSDEWGWITAQNIEVSGGFKL